MPGFLERMAESSRARAKAARARAGFASLERRATSAPVPLPLRLDRFDLIAELKLRSPAMGALADAAFDAG